MPLSLLFSSWLISLHQWQCTQNNCFKFYQIMHEILPNNQELAFACLFVRPIAMNFLANSTWIKQTLKSGLCGYGFSFEKSTKGVVCLLEDGEFVLTGLPCSKQHLQPVSLTHKHLHPSSGFITLTTLQITNHWFMKTPASSVYCNMVLTIMM